MARPFPVTRFVYHDIKTVVAALYRNPELQAMRLPAAIDQMIRWSA